MRPSDILYFGSFILAIAGIAAEVRERRHRKVWADASDSPVGTMGDAGCECDRKHPANTAASANSLAADVADA